MYNVGIYGGSFNPLHLGHVDCILKAAGLCKELYVILSESRGMNQIPMRVRYRWVYQTVSHLGNVSLIVISDDTSSKDEYTIENALEDSEYIKGIIGKPVDVVFTGSDYKEDSFYRKCYPKSDFVTFERNEISSTKIRENPLKYWDWIPSCVKPYYVKKILIMGIESTGKSVLSINLSKHFNTNFVEEAGRDLAMRSGDDRYMLPCDYTEILLRHKLNEMEAVNQSNRYLFIDTDVCYTRFYLDFLEKGLYDSQIKLADAINGINDYDLILYLEPDVPFVQDGGRSEEMAADREKYSKTLKDVISAYGKKIVSLSGTYNEKFDKAVELVEKLQ